MLALLLLLAAVSILSLQGITLNVMFLVSLKNMEDLLHERGVGVSNDSVWYWQHRH